MKSYDEIEASIPKAAEEYAGGKWAWREADLALIRKISFEHGAQNILPYLKEAHEAIALKDAEIAKLREALKFYAEAKYSGVTMISLAFDKGDIARAALKPADAGEVKDE